jgi:monoterpene epsilon-lactone hydrolase
LNDRTNESTEAKPRTLPAGVIEVPARIVPTPTTVSVEMQRLVDSLPSPSWNASPRTVDEWKPIVEAADQAAARRIPKLCAAFGVRIEKAMIGGVRAYMVIPAAVAPENRDRLLIHLHGGCYVLNGGEAGLPEAILMAGFGGFRVIAVDYRMPPEGHFPSAHDDAVAVWKAALGMTSPAKMAIFGTSAGGALTLATVLIAKRDRIPLPAALGVGTPMSDVTKTGDTFHTNAMIDNVLVAPDGFCDAGVRAYANGHDLAVPLLSPVNGDLSGFPPTILVSGTRDLLLSNTVRVHRKLRQASVEAELHIYEAQSHAHYLRDHTAPETKETFDEFARFFDRHLQR